MSSFNKKQHFVYSVGCKAPNSDEQCYVCRVVKKAGTEQCLDVCPSTSMINKNRECRLVRTNKNNEGIYLARGDSHIKKNEGAYGKF